MPARTKGKKGYSFDFRSPVRQGTPFCHEPCERKNKGETERGARPSEPEIELGSKDLSSGARRQKREEGVQVAAADGDDVRL